VKRVEIIPLEVIVRNYAAGSISRRLGLEEGIRFDQPIVEFCYKNDELGDPMVNNYHILAMKLANEEEINALTQQALRIIRFCRSSCLVKTSFSWTLSWNLAEQTKETLSWQMRFHLIPAVFGTAPPWKSWTKIGSDVTWRSRRSLHGNSSSIGCV